MTRARGSRLQNALAAYLRPWWPHAESAGAGRNGTDVIGTPGVVWECKTATNFKAGFSPTEWVRQSAAHARVTDLASIPVVVYFPAGIGEQNTANTLAIVPLHVLMHLLENAQFAPKPVPQEP